MTPWVPPGTGGANITDPCTGDVPVNVSGTYCGVAVQFAPYAVATAFLSAGAKFQSKCGTGVSQPIGITFNVPVSSVTVTAYDPTFSGNRMEAFDASGASLGVAPFPGNGIPGTLTTQTRTLSGSISRILLTPAPIDYLAYSMEVQLAPTANLRVVCHPAAPIRGTEVGCTISMTDSSSFRLNRLRSTTGTVIIIDQVVDTSVTTFEWVGPAATSTRVEAFATASGAPIEASADFTITARVFADAVQPEAPPQQKATGRPFLSQDYPGILITSDGWAVLVGGLGHTWHKFPDYEFQRVGSGPNTNLVFAVGFQWIDTQPVGATQPIPSGTYITAALFPDDPFYRRQRGRGGNCGSSDMETLRREVHEHEWYHYTRVIQRRHQARLHEVMEARLALSTADPVPAPIRVAFNEPVLQYAQAVLATDLGIDADPATIFKTSLTCAMRP